MQFSSIYAPVKMRRERKATTVTIFMCIMCIFIQSASQRWGFLADDQVYIHKAPTNNDNTHLKVINLWSGCNWLRSVECKMQALLTFCCYRHVYPLISFMFAHLHRTGFSLKMSEKKVLVSRFLISHANGVSSVCVKWTFHSALHSRTEFWPIKSK